MTTTNATHQLGLGSSYSASIAAGNILRVNILGQKGVYDDANCSLVITGTTLTGIVRVAASADPSTDGRYAVAEGGTITASSDGKAYTFPMPITGIEIEATTGTFAVDIA